MAVGRQRGSRAPLLHSLFPSARIRRPRAQALLPGPPARVGEARTAPAAAPGPGLTRHGRAPRRHSTRAPARRKSERARTRFRFRPPKPGGEPMAAPRGARSLCACPAPPRASRWLAWPAPPRPAHPRPRAGRRACAALLVPLSRAVAPRASRPGAGVPCGRGRSSLTVRARCSLLQLRFGRANSRSSINTKKTKLSIPNCLLQLLWDFCHFLSEAWLLMHSGSCCAGLDWGKITFHTGLCGGGGFDL